MQRIDNTIFCSHAPSKTKREQLTNSSRFLWSQAAANDDVKTLVVQIEIEGHDVNEKDSCGRTPLHAAAYAGQSTPRPRVAS